MPASSSKVVAIGASTGGPKTVQALLAALPSGFPSPLLLVQHLSHGFARGFAQWLQRGTPFPVRVVERPEPLRKSTVYLAPEGSHLEVRKGKAVVTRGQPVNGCRPSVDILFHSLARECGGEALAVLLTGMGRDGALGALAVREAGGEVIVQDESTSVIFGMPQAAIELGGATRVVPAGELPRALAESVGNAQTLRLGGGV